jgi:glyoxylase-like metal-dependent hydrolase (beta-lactamase superfamily II)
VDPGFAGSSNLARLRELLSDLGRHLSDVRSIIITHGHYDHLGLATTIKEASGARLLMHPREQPSFGRTQPASALVMTSEWGIPQDRAAGLAAQLAAASRAGVSAQDPPPADVLLTDGHSLPIPGFAWTVVATPWHTPGHISLVDQERRLLLSGDHVLPTVFPGIGLGGPTESDPLADYLHSLDRLAPFDDFEVVPGHGYRFHGLQERRAAARHHVLRRADEVAAAIEHSPDATIYQIAARLTWSAGWTPMADSIMLYSALLQTQMYRNFVAAS